MINLKLDCVRSILLCVEENERAGKLSCFISPDLYDAVCCAGEISPPKEYQLKLLENYSIRSLLFHVNYCISEKLVVEATSSTAVKLQLSGLTETGREFLSSGRGTIS